MDRRDPPPPSGPLLEIRELAQRLRAAIEKQAKFNLAPGRIQCRARPHQSREQGLLVTYGDADYDRWQRFAPSRWETMADIRSACVDLN